MGVLQTSQEVSQEELEKMEMEVDDEFNPQEQEGYQSARQSYLERQRDREAEHLRQKYLKPEVAQKAEAEAANKKHHLTREGLHVHTKKREQRKVRYVFPGAVEARGEPSDDKEDGEGDSISDILI